MEKNSAANLLTSIDSLFTTQQERDLATQPRVEEISLDLIDDFPDHPFKVRMDESMTEMADSIKQYGVLVPAIVRQKEDGRYEMVAGHRRKAACELVGKTKIPCVVRDLTLEEAVVVMVDSNLQREQILPSEKAFAYKMKLDAMKRQGMRVDLTSATSLQKLERKTSGDLLAEQSGESHEQIRKFIRLTALVPEILDLVDNTVLKEKDKLQIALRPAVELSYLAQQEQQALYETMITEDCTPSHAQAMKIRKYAEEGRLNPDVILSILQEEKPNQKEQFKIPKERISKYFAPGTPAQKIEDTIVKYGKIQIQKSMASEGSVQGWKFRIMDAIGAEIPGSPFTTDASGLILTGKLQPGTYTVEELIPEDSLYHCTSENPQTVTVKAGETARVIFTNALRPGKITIQKVDSRGEPLNGATFLLEWSEDGAAWQRVVYTDSSVVTKGCCFNSDSPDGTLTSGEDGYLEWTGLHPGLLYRVTELEAPEGYSLLTEPAFEGRLPADQLSLSFRVVNCEIFKLPETGGISAALFQAARFACMVICGVMLTVSYRKERRK